MASETRCRRSREWWRTVDHLFFGILLFSVAGHFGLIAAVSGRTLEEVDVVPESIGDAWLPPVTFRPPPPLTRVPAVGPAAGPRHAPRRVRHGVGPTRKAGDVGLLPVLGADTFGELLREDGPADLRTALSHASRGGRVAGLGLGLGLGTRRGDASGTSTEIGVLDTGGSGAVDLGGRNALRIAGTVSATPPETDNPDLDRPGLEHFLKANLRGIQGCYEHALKLTPDLRGKLAVGLVLTPEGRIGDVEVDEDTLHSAAVVDCIRARLRLWQLPFHPAAETRLQLSWNFVAAE